MIGLFSEYAFGHFPSLIYKQILKPSLDIRYPTMGFHQTKQYKHYTKIPEQSTQAHGQCTLVH
jgi:hypothetical protein